MSSIDDNGYKPGEKERAAGIRDAALIRQATAVAVAIANASQLVSNYKKQKDIQDEALKIAEEERKHAMDVYWPRELEFLKEFTKPEDSETAEMYGRRFAGRMAATVANQFAQMISRLKSEASRYCSSQYVRTLQAAYQAQSVTLANVRSTGYIMGFAYWKARTDRDDQRRLQAIAIGKGLMEKAASLLKAAGAGLASAGAGYTEGISRALEGFKMAYVNSLNSVPNYQYYVDQQSDNNSSVRFTERYGYESGDPLMTGVQRTSFQTGTGYIDSQQLWYQGYDDYNKQVTPILSNSWDITNNLGSKTSEMYSLREGWNNGDIGWNDLVRTGSKEYSFRDSDGDTVRFTIDLEKDFPQYVYKDPEHY